MEIQLLERKQRIEAYFIKFGAIKIKLSSGSCWTYNAYYFRVDIIRFPAKPFFVIEYADTEEGARNNVFEDCDPFPYDLEEELFIGEI